MKYTTENTANFLDREIYSPLNIIGTNSTVLSHATHPKPSLFTRQLAASGGMIISTDDYFEKGNK